ncbi:uncharacterized protein VTP21DRAFT_2717 [Calcarisporiella thermophila]|uniref:uncharacterized protein n=1 Tax=Calcarisporiella thermophila TaxID=911321 RepID=UPI0037436EDD
MRAFSRQRPRLLSSMCTRKIIKLRPKPTLESRSGTLLNSTRHLCISWPLRQEITAAQNGKLTPRIFDLLEAKRSRHEQLVGVINKEAASMDSTRRAQVSKEMSELEDIVNTYREWQIACETVKEIQKMASDADNELRQLAEEEEEQTWERIEELESQMLEMLIPKDTADSGNAILEIRAGTGGDEAGLFAGDVLRMYERYALAQGWKFEILSISGDDRGMVKDATVNVSGHGVFGKLKAESGVHRVQRVPVTENQGRVHTSTITVAILPQPTEVDVVLREQDLKIDVFRSGGAGGQHVNTTDSAVRITHIPTGIVVAIQDERSQHRNKAKALKVLRAKLFEIERERIDSDRREERRKQVGTAKRSEKIRTYNYPQSRVTDHRLNLTLHDLAGVMAGGPPLEEIIAELRRWEEERAIAELSNP